MHLLRLCPSLTHPKSKIWNENARRKKVQLTIAEDKDSGDYTRLTKFKDGYSSRDLGAKVHDYPEEIFVVSGRIYDEAFKIWLEPGYYASRPPGEIHGPFVADGDVVILEMSYPSQSISSDEIV